MTDGLYEQYKEALRRGHVAGLRGRIEDAVTAYDLAASLAPSRPVPHVSKGAALFRAGRFDAAVAAYDVALRLAPGDEAALSGRAETLIRAGRRTDAAEALDLLATIQEGDGRLADACDTARRALEQAESKTRRRHVEALTRTLERTIGDLASEVALSKALKVLEGTLPALSHAPARTEGAGSHGARPVPKRIIHGSAGPTGPGGTAARAPKMPTEADLPRLLADAETALGSGDVPTACDRLLSIASIHLAADRLEAALDMCYQALAIAPADTEIHLALVEAYVARGWLAPAQEKLLLLGRLLELAGDDAGRMRLCGVIAARFPDDPQLRSLCA